MTNKFASLARANLNAMLTPEQLASAGIGHNMGDELDALGLDVKNAAEAIALASTYRAKAETAKGEAATAKVTALIATAQAAFTVGIKADNKDAQWTALVQAFSGAKTAGSLAKESSILKRAVELQSKRLLVKTMRGAETMMREHGDAGLRAFENVFESLCAFANKNGRVPSFEEMKDKVVKREPAPRAASKDSKSVQPEKAEIDVDTVGDRFISNFAEVAANMSPDDAEATLQGIVAAAKEKLAAIYAERAAKAKAAEATTAMDVGTKGKGRKAKRQSAE